MRIYISGKISNNDGFYKQFLDAEVYLKTAFRCQVFNPAKINESHKNMFRFSDFINKTKTFKSEWIYHMYFCLEELYKCQKIYMLKNWKNSDGAKIEFELAKKLGLEVIYEI